MSASPSSTSAFNSRRSISTWSTSSPPPMLAIGMQRSSIASPRGRWTRSRGVPEKRIYGSDYPFRNIGQLDGVSSATDATTSLISAPTAASAPFWGSQLMPFTASSFDSWPIGVSVLRPHYEAVLSQIPFSGEEDDLASTSRSWVSRPHSRNCPSGVSGYCKPMNGIARRSAVAIPSLERLGWPSMRRVASGVACA